MPSAQITLPSDQTIESGQLIVHSDFRLPRKHRLLDELTALRSDVATKLSLGTSDEPINVFLFENSDRYDNYLAKTYPQFPYRRAFFLKTDTELKVFAYWGERVGEDLRHEVTHGYLHSVVPNMPLWLDEGIAEYFEVPRGRHGFNIEHIKLLASELRNEKWNPDLKQLEQKTYIQDLRQIDYAESWLWIHFLLESDAKRLYVLRQHLNELVDNGEAQPMSQILNELESNIEHKLLQHLLKLAEQL